MSRIVYLPVTAAVATRLRAHPDGPCLGFSATPGLRDQLAEGGPEPGPDEVEYAALNTAGIAQLVDPRADDPRLVLAAEVDDGQVFDLDAAAPGAATVAKLDWSSVTAVFADDPDAAPRVAAARRAVRGRDLADALAAPEVAVLLDAHDLLWYAPTELDDLT